MVSKALEPLLNTDAYKLGHIKQYPDNTEYVFSNFTPRKSRIEGIDHVIHFGLQAFLVQLEEAFEPFFAADGDEVAAEYEEFLASVLGPDNNIGSDHIKALHDLGYLPLEFRALPEGTRVPIRVPHFTITNTLPEFFWLVNYFETWISAAVWQPGTTATIADHYRQILQEGALITDPENLAGVDFQGHDFSARGMPGMFAAAASGAGHLLSFRGSDTLAVKTFVDHYYGDHTGGGLDDYSGFLLASVPATEHSVMSAGGKATEYDTYKRLITKTVPSGFVSIVSDTWDLWNVLTEILPRLFGEIMDRDGRVVIRPDSGDPVDILMGTLSGEYVDYLATGGESSWEDFVAFYEKGEPLTPAEKGVVWLLWDLFKGTLSSTGFKKLDSHIGAIYGDSITPQRSRDIIHRGILMGFASTNVVDGIGSFSYQYQTRDTFSSAIKATHVIIHGEGFAISKDPITDSGMKKSAVGYLGVAGAQNGSELYLVDGLTDEEFQERFQWDNLTPKYRDGKFLNWESFEDIRGVVGNLV